MFNRNGAMGLRLRCIEWDGDYSIGHEIIDLEHKLLFFKANAFRTAVKHGLGAERILPMLETLTEYAKTHFFDEELLMSEKCYSGFLEHKACHDGFLSAIDAFKTQVAHGDNISEELAYFMQNWLQEHVSKVDTELRHYIPTPPGGV